MVRNKTTIPNEWTLDRLGKQVRFEYGSGLPERDRERGEYPVYGSSGVVSKHVVAKIKGPGIVVGRKGTIGSVIWSKQDFWPIDTTYYVEANDSIDQRWLYYQLQQLQLNRLNTASGVPGLNREEVYKLLCLFPPKKEQEKIAEVLSAVDEDIEKTDAVIAQTEKLKKGLMQELFTRGIGHTEFKKTKLGDIPEEWRIDLLGKVVDVRDGTHASPKYISVGVPLVTSKNLIDGTIDFTESNLISKEDLCEIEKRSNVEDGDILFGMIGTIGNPVIVKKDRDFGIKNVALLKFKNSLINNQFVYYLLSYLLDSNRLIKNQDGSSQKFIALGVIRNIAIPIPVCEEQNKIAAILSVVDEKISITRKNKEKLIQLKKGLMSDLLSGSVRVKI